MLGSLKLQMKNSNPSQVFQQSQRFNVSIFEQDLTERHRFWIFRWWDPEQAFVFVNKTNGKW